MADVPIRALPYNSRSRRRAEPCREEGGISSVSRLEGRPSSLSGTIAPNMANIPGHMSFLCDTPPGCLFSLLQEGLSVMRVVRGSQHRSSCFRHDTTSVRGSQHRSSCFRHDITSASIYLTTA